ncbi:CHAD domain-containing protein [Calidifontibacter terrae]
MPTRSSGTDELPGASTFADLLAHRLATQAAELRERAAAVAAGDAEAVHRMRVAARRSRAALTTAKPLLSEPADDLLAELRWLGQVLGGARDAEVLHRRLHTALDGEDPTLVLGPVRRRIDLELGRARRAGVAAAEEALRSDRYARLLAALDALAADPPLSATADGDVHTVLARLVRRDARRLRRAVRAAMDSAPEERDIALHEARKKAKRLRYAGELARPVGGRRTRRLVRRVKAVQQLLGDHQDSVVARELLRRLGAMAHLDDENGFTFGLLYDAERHIAERLVDELADVWHRVPGPKRAARWVEEG